MLLGPYILTCVSARGSPVGLLRGAGPGMGPCGTPRGCSTDRALRRELPTPGRAGVWPLQRGEVPALGSGCGSEAKGCSPLRSQRWKDRG